MAAHVPAGDGPAYRYRLFGLAVASTLRLDELGPPRDEDGPADVEIAVGPLSAFANEKKDGFALVEGGGLLHVGEAGRFLIADGRSIRVAPAPGASERNVRLYLLGSAFGVLLHQRGLLPLHANAIEIEGRAVAFLGHSGAGKSTMAAWFHDRGFNVLADDVCVVTTDRQILAWPGIPRLRLWREALEHSGRTADGYEMSFDDMDKYNVPTRREGLAAPLPLGAVYLLARAGDEAPSIRPLGGMAAVDALVANTYRGGYLPVLGGAGRHLGQCVALARSLPVFEVKRAWGYDALDAELARLEAHARAMLAPGAARAAVTP